MSTLIVNVNENSFDYDIHSLIKAFYPETDVKVIDSSLKESSDEGLPDIFIEIYPEKILISYVLDKDIRVNKIETEGFSRPEVKSALKQLIYRTISDSTGKELPWGTLTGIRPTKIPMGMLNEGVEKELICTYMKDTYLLSDEKMELAIAIAEREQNLLKKIDYENGYSLYIGIPFCPTTCLYCSFTSFPICAYRDKADLYLDALIKELEFTATQFKGKNPYTIYIGGGTPTTLSPALLEKLLGRVSELFDIPSLFEFTVEAGRADSITEEKLRVLRKYGVNRISVNPQTMNQKTLDLIGRRHTVEDVIEAFDLARKMGFENINMDIILGLPGEEEKDVRITIDEISKLRPDSLTVHSLAVKRASKLSEWIKENGIKMLKNTDETMKIASEGAMSMGMNPYYLYRQKNMSGNFENVGYSAPGKEGIYNILIMEEVQTIVACGAGTVTKRVFPEGRIERCDDVKDVNLYIEKIDEMIERKKKLFAEEGVDFPENEGKSNEEKNKK